METPNKHAGDEAFSPRPPKKRRLTNLKIRLPTSCTNILPDLLLIDVDNVAHMHKNDRRCSYLYEICSLLLDQSQDEMIILGTTDGIDEDDDSMGWTPIPNDETEYQGGVYLCKPTSMLSPPMSY